MINILGIRIIDRIKEAGLTQGLLSKHASSITTRLGFHEVSDEVCSREAYIILHLDCQESEKKRLITELEEIGGIDLREMLFENKTHPSVESNENSNVSILGILVERDPELVSVIQRILTQYGCNIRTRLGVNVNYSGVAAGLIILELKGAKDQRDLLVKRLKAIERLQVRTMVF